MTWEEFWQFIVNTFSYKNPSGAGNIGPSVPPGGGNFEQDPTSPDFGESKGDILQGEQPKPFSTQDELSEGAEDFMNSNNPGDYSDLLTDLNVGAGDNPLATYLKDNPGSSPEDAYKYMSTISDEYAEKWIDYLLEKQSVQTAYDREDSAYQRLVQDLKKAGLNPALLYGSSASTTGSPATINMSGSAKSSSVDNKAKLKKVLLAYMTYQWQRELDGNKFGLQFAKTLYSIILDMI